MNDQTLSCTAQTQPRGFQPEQEGYFEMNTTILLTPDERQHLAAQAGQFLLAIGSLLSSQSAFSTGHSRGTGQNLVSIGRKLIQAGKSIPCL